MSNIKSEFEKNVIHKQILDHVRFSEKSNQYLPVDALSSVDRACADVANVGWISYQYQQSKIDELQTKLADSEKTRSVLYQENIDLRELNDIIAKHAAEKDELQKQNAWLSGVAERENKRANNLQQDKTSTTILLGKTVQEKNELTKQRDSFIKAYEIEMDKSIELQKRVDALIQKYKDEDRELKLIDEWEKSQIYGLVASELEQVLKGGGE